MSFIQMPSYRLSITSTPAKLSIKSKRIGFRMSNKAPKMDVNVQRSSMNPDWEGYYSQVGLKSAGQLAQANAMLSKQAGIEASSNYVNNGNQMGDIENGGTAGQVMSGMAVSSMDSKIPEVNVGFTPQDRLEIDWTASNLDVNWSDAQFSIDWDKEFRPDIEYTAASVEIKVEAVERKNFEVKPVKLLGSSGKYVNKDV